MLHCDVFAHCTFLVTIIRNPANGCRNPRLLALVHYVALAIQPCEDINNPNTRSSVTLPRPNRLHLTRCLKLRGLRVGGTRCATQTALHHWPEVD
jgi:hypothetical protein